MCGARGRTPDVAPTTPWGDLYIRNARWMLGILSQSFVLSRQNTPRRPLPTTSIDLPQAESHSRHYGYDLAAALGFQQCAVTIGISGYRSSGSRSWCWAVPTYFSTGDRVALICVRCPSVTLRKPAGQFREYCGLRWVGRSAQTNWQVQHRDRQPRTTHPPG